MVVGGAAEVGFIILGDKGKDFAVAVTEGLAADGIGFIVGSREGELAGFEVSDLIGSPVKGCLGGRSYCIGHTLSLDLGAIEGLINGCLAFAHFKGVRGAVGEGTFRTCSEGHAVNGDRGSGRNGGSISACALKGAAVQGHFTTFDCHRAAITTGLHQDIVAIGDGVPCPQLGIGGQRSLAIHLQGLLATSLGEVHGQVGEAAGVNGKLAFAVWRRFQDIRAILRLFQGIGGTLRRICPLAIFVEVVFVGSTFGHCLADCLQSAVLCQRGGHSLGSVVSRFSFTIEGDAAVISQDKAVTAALRIGAIIFLQEFGVGVVEIGLAANGDFLPLVKATEGVFAVSEGDLNTIAGHRLDNGIGITHRHRLLPCESSRPGAVYLYTCGHVLESLAADSVVFPIYVGGETFACCHVIKGQGSGILCIGNNDDKGLSIPAGGHADAVDRVGAVTCRLDAGGSRNCYTSSRSNADIRPCRYGQGSSACGGQQGVGAIGELVPCSQLAARGQSGSAVHFQGLSTSSCREVYSEAGEAAGVKGDVRISIPRGGKGIAVCSFSQRVGNRVISHRSGAVCLELEGQIFFHQ